jgi:hypothetical protein
MSRMTDKGRNWFSISRDKLAQNNETGVSLQQKFFKNPFKPKEEN